MSLLKEAASFLRRLNTRFFWVGVAVIAMTIVLVYRLFTLQIVNGETYLNNFQLRIRRTISIPATRGNIYDRNGKLLAYNELAYSVTLKDELEEDSSHNRRLNEIVSNAIDIIEKNGDTVTDNFNITIDENGNYAYKVSGTQLLRFLADVYGYQTTDELTKEQESATAEQVIVYLCGSGRFAIGEYVDDTDADGNPVRTFVACKGYEDDKGRLLKMVTIRYLVNLNSYQRYISATIATNVSEETVAAILESTDTLEGINIEDTSVRRYTDSKYFAQILGYTGEINETELEELSETNAGYAAGDMIGKSGIEKSMDAELQGTKGEKTVYVNNLGKEIETTGVVDAAAGNDVYLTIDAGLQEAAYDILEKNLSEILLSRIENIKEYVAGEDDDESDIVIPIYDVYYAPFRNNILDVDHFSAADAKDTEQKVYAQYLVYEEETMNKLYEEFHVSKTPYNGLTDEFQTYQSYIVQMLKDNGVLVTSRIDREDETYVAWTNDEVISMTEFLRYAITQNWIDASLLGMEDPYTDADTALEAIYNYIVATLREDNEFRSYLYHYMLLNDYITGTDVCKLLIEQGCVLVSGDEEANLYAGVETPYDFMIRRITNRDLTPAQLALDPHSGSMVITDVNTGDVLALVSYPGYDNNMMANTVDADYYAQLLSDKSTPLINYATQQLTAPGSTFKPVTATAGLMEGAITTDTIIECTNTFDLVYPEVHCWVYPNGAHGKLNVSGAITNSCNVFFSQIGYQLGQNSEGDYSSDRGVAILRTYADMYGLGDSTGIEIEESVGSISTEDSVRSAFGQGNANYTTVGLARYVTTLANSGTCYDLTLVDRVETSGQTVVTDNAASIRNIINMDSSYWDAIHTGMRGVVENMSFFSDLTVQVAGKTGTAQESTTRANHALFIGYAPYNNPQIAVATRIANGYKSSYAAQTTSDVLKYYFGQADVDTLLADDSGMTEETVGD